MRGKRYIFTLITLILSALAHSNENNKTYNPWYTGALIAPSATNLEPEKANIQPLLYINDQFSIYTKHGHLHNKNSVVTVHPFIFMQYGLTNFLDVTFGIGSYINHKKNINTINFQDISVNFGLQVYRENDYIPNIRITIEEKFPTGRYDKLNPNKQNMDIGGQGAYETTINLNMSKTVYWIKNHPMRFTLAGNAAINSKVLVKDFNTFGGGYNTRGKVTPPTFYNGFFSLEFSLTQRWVVTGELTYSYATRSKFSGQNGIKADGKTAKNTLNTAYTWAIAPEIEYNLSENFGFIFGMWFTLKGMNSPDFLNTIFSFTYTY